MGISYVTVWDILNGRSHSDITNIKRKKKTDNRRYTNDEIKAIVFWNSQGCSCKEIGEKLGIDLRIIWSVINGLSHTDITGLKPSDRKHNDRLTHEELDVILEMNKNGVDSYKIAKELNREVFIIQRVLYGGAYSDYTGIKYKAPREKKKQEDYKIIDQILELNKKGISQKEIAEKLNIEKTKVSKILCGKSYSEYTHIVYIPKKGKNKGKIMNLDKINNN